MNDRKKLEKALEEIVTESDICNSCVFRHYIEDQPHAICFFALECIANKHNDYKKEKKK